MNTKLNIKQTDTPNEPAAVEFFRSISEQYLYWVARKEPECANFAAAFKNLMHELTRDTNE